MSLTLNIVGAGRVGKTLARLWQQQSTFTMQGVACRTPENAAAACGFIGAGSPSLLQELPQANVWMLAVPDSEIATVASDLAQHHINHPPSTPPPIVFHCAGAATSELLASLSDLGWLTASAHCILSFANVETALSQFTGTACALEGHNAACAVLQAAFEAIGAQCFTVQAQDKLLYHAAAVFATNFLPVLQSVAEEAWAASGVPESLLPQLRKTLLQNAVHNITTLGPAAALTGPAARGDVAHIARQSAAVHAWQGQAGAAYDALSALALQLAAKRPSNAG
jgi:predicted short-subunit dehydrogenase-like oxidoreductase (DUF2520 family)